MAAAAREDAFAGVRAVVERDVDPRASRRDWPGWWPKQADEDKPLDARFLALDAAARQHGWEPKYEMLLDAAIARVPKFLVRQACVRLASELDALHAERGLCDLGTSRAGWACESPNAQAPLDGIPPCQMPPTLRRLARELSSMLGCAPFDACVLTLFSAECEVEPGRGWTRGGGMESTRDALLDVARFGPLTSHLALGKRRLGRLGASFRADLGVGDLLVVAASSAVTRQPIRLPAQPSRASRGDFWLVSFATLAAVTPTAAPAASAQQQNEKKASETTSIK